MFTLHLCSIRSSAPLNPISRVSWIIAHLLSNTPFDKSTAENSFEWSLSGVTLAVLPHLPLRHPARVSVELRQPPLEVAPERLREPVADVVAEDGDPALPVGPLATRRRVLQRQQVLDDAPDPAPQAVPPILPQVRDLLGETVKVERDVRAGGGEAAQLARLGLRPGVEVAFVEFGGRVRSCAEDREAAREGQSPRPTDAGTPRGLAGREPRSRWRPLPF